MTQRRTLDDRIELVRLVPQDELVELVSATTRAMGCALAVFDIRGARLAGSDAAGPPSRELEYHGEPLARLAASGSRADAALELIAETLGLLVHHAHARELAAATHEEAMRLTFAELTEHNQRLQRAVARLEELDRLKSNFLATMSHELRTPLTSVIGYAEMMTEGLAGPVTTDQREYLTTILGKADQLLGLITSVLEVSSLETGQLTLERTMLSIAELVASEIATFQPQANRRGIAIQVDIEASITVLGDRRKIRQVVTSLLSNAVKFTPDRGNVGVAVRTGPLEPGNDDGERAVQLVVRDSGIGISRDQVAKIFEPFFQVDSSSTRAFGGTGLGLTLAKAYVEAHGGRIWVDTAPGQGSTFTASFPVRSNADVGEAAAP
ncbi:MAG: sensor histidine kinase [Kofleriaceae bacterium]